MLSREAIQEQLTKAGCNFRFWGRSEIRELERILMEDEVISLCVNGEYANGFAMLVSTNHRLLLVDKKPLLYLTVEDIRFDMITDFNYNHRLTTATICISTPNKSLTFMSWNKKALRKLLDGLQQRVLDLRKQHDMSRYFDSFRQMPAGFQEQMTQWQQAQSMPQPPAQEPPRQVEPQSYYAPNVAPQPAPENANPTVAHAMNRASFVASRFAAKRAALGTYTRSKLPAFRHHADQPTAQSGEIYPAENYTPTATPDYQIPYEY